MSVPFYYYYLQYVLAQDEPKLSDLGISLIDSNGKIKNAVDLIEELWNDEKAGEQLNDSNK